VDPLVLCCRQAEYEALPERAKLGGRSNHLVRRGRARSIRYLAGRRRRAGRAVRARLLGCERAEASGICCPRPLMLNVAVLAYQSDDPTELCGMQHTGAGARPAVVPLHFRP